MNTPGHGLKCITVVLLGLLLCACAGRAPDIYIPKTAPKPLPPRHPVRVAIVLGAGGARGYAHLGVLSVLQHAGVPIDLVVGASAGSLVGALYADNGNAAQATKALLNAGFWDLADIGNFPNFKGPIEGYHLQKFLLKHMRSKTFRQTKIKFIAVATNLANGNMVRLESGPIPPAVLASAAVPGAVRPVHLYGNVLVDGGMVDPVPVDVAKRFHPKIIIAVNICKEINNNIPWNWYGIYNKAFALSWYRLTLLTERGANLIIRPQVGDIGTFDIGDKYQMYQTGIKAARKALPRIKALLRAQHIALLNPKRITNRHHHTH